MKRKPTGYIAICQCGNIVGAIDLDRSDRQDAGKTLGLWVSEGHTLEPRFGSEWSETITGCKCAHTETMK